MTAFPWTEEQEAVLKSDARIRLVQAGPGSGKTRIFAELLDREIRDWNKRPGGIAALSFTNAARREIEERVSEAATYPHFVGTLDAFFLRFVIGPFGHLAGLPRSGAHLIPSPLDEEMAKPDVNFGTFDKPNPVSVFRITAVAGTDEAPIFQVKPRFGAKKLLVPQHLESQVKAKKEEVWKKRGQVTHGDCSYLVARILCGPYGKDVRRLLIQRFPLICVDEFQDTGHFLSRAMLSILREANLRAILVGDIDQKIFGFSGVSGDLFSEVATIAGTEQFALHISQRCCKPVAAAASMLSRSGSEVKATPTSSSGRLQLLKHTDSDAQQPATLAKAVSLAQAEGCSTMAILVRARTTKARLLKKSSMPAPTLRCRGAIQLAKAVQYLQRGQGHVAAGVATAFICRCISDDERPTPDELKGLGIDVLEVRRRVRKMLTTLTPNTPGETWGQWSSRAKDCCVEIAESVGAAGYKQRLSALFKANKKDKPDVPRPELQAISDSAIDDRVEVLTIHEAKGREFDAVAIYWEKPRKIAGGDSTCPAEAWWAAANASEEREVAFVACTRARRVLVLSVHELSYKALSSHRPQFVGLFEQTPSAAS